MTSTTSTAIHTTPSSWLQTLYFTRAAFSLIWVALAFTVAQTSPVIASVLLVLYPAWDALANALDAKKSGGLSANPLQTINTVISAITTAAMAVAVSRGMSAVFVVFGAWAVLSGLLQLGTALKRWKTSGAQWAMALSGAQSALAGVLFVTQANGPDPMLQRLAGYAAVGALYFLISASVLLYRKSR